MWEFLLFERPKRQKGDMMFGTWGHVGTADSSKILADCDLNLSIVGEVKQGSRGYEQDID
jgi:hypothetical protein